MERLHQSISFLTCWKLRHATQEVHSLNEEELEMQNIAEIAAPLNDYNAISNIISDNMSTSDNYSEGNTPDDLNANHRTLRRISSVRRRSTTYILTFKKIEVIDRARNKSFH